MSEEDINSETCRRLIDEVVLANNRTVQGALGGRSSGSSGDGAMYRLEKDHQDEYSQVIWPDEIRRFQQQVKGRFVGVGILIRHDDRRQVVIVNPLEGSPAARSGSKAGTSSSVSRARATVGWSLNRAVDEITGPVGEDVVLTIKRKGVEDPLDLAITEIRSRCVPSMAGGRRRSTRKASPPGIGTSMKSRHRIRPPDLVQRRQLRRLSRGARGDAGGPSDEGFDPRPSLQPRWACSIRSGFSNLFVDEGVIVSGEDRTRKTVWELPAQPEWLHSRDLPTVILVNHGSASASEIVAGASRPMSPR